MFSRRTADNRERARENGQAAVELVIVLPVLLLILFAILQFGFVFRGYLALTDAVRAGARQGAVSRQEDDPAGMTADAVVAAAGDLGDGLEVTVNSTWDPGAELEVVATYPYTVRLLGIIDVTDGELRSETKERVE
jgi:Flp pilus assembly protein TadG